MKFILSLILLSHFSFSQTITVSQKDSLISELKLIIYEKYAITNKAKLISDSLLAKKYLKISNTDSLVKQINRDLYYFSKDKHLNLQYDTKMAASLLKKVDTHIAQDAKEKKENFGFKKRQILEGNIGYLKFDYFADTKNAGKTVESIMASFKNTKALILDLTGNGGGSGSMVQLLASYFLPEEETPLLKISYRSGDVVTLKTKKINPDFKYAEKPLYILCSEKTFSAAEAFTFILQNNSRATIIGETTAGAGNISGPYPICNKFVITIPVGTIVDPITKRGWEQKGVSPTYYCSSAKALDKALELIQSAK